MDFLTDIGITLVLSAIKESVKNEVRKAALKKAFLKIRNAINNLYPGE